MKRRTLLKSAAAALLPIGWTQAKAQRAYRLGWLSTSDEPNTKPFLEGGLLVGMRSLGYEVGRNLVVDVRYGRGDVTHLSDLADELIALKPDVLIGIEAACRAMTKRTSTIPIVMLFSPDPVAAGLVKTFARPGTNVTGISNQVLTGKLVELLIEIVPRLTRVILINDASFAGRDMFERLAREAAESKKLTLAPINALPTSDGIRAAFAQIGNRRGTGILVVGTGPQYFLRNIIAEEAFRSRLPAVYPAAVFVDAGGLISYGANILETYRREVPPYVDRILKGANPAEMPVQQSAIFEIVVNKKVAQAIGLTIPRTVLLRADRVIE